MRDRLSTFLAVALLLMAASCSKKSTSNESAATQPPPPAVSEVQQSTEAAKPPEASEPVVVPAGTTLTVSLGTALSSKTSQPGQPFSATVAKAVSVDGHTAIPAGSPAEGTVLDAKKQGAFKGEGTLALKLTSVTIHGRNYPLSTNTFAQTVKGKGKRTAKSVGGIAAGGALIGGLAGGGKGAAVGALVGAGAGTAVAGATGGENVNLAAETALSFKLQAPLTIQPE